MGRGSGGKVLIMGGRYHGWVLADQKDGAVFKPEIETVDMMHTWAHGRCDRFWWWACVNDEQELNSSRIWTTPLRTFFARRAMHSCGAMIW